MATAVFHQTVGPLQSHKTFNVSQHQKELGNFTMSFLSRGFKFDIGMSRNVTSLSKPTSLRAIHASTSEAPMCNPVLSTSNGSGHESPKKSSKADPEHGFTVKCLDIYMQES